jgi:hypothetical protein
MSFGNIQRGNHGRKIAALIALYTFRTQAFAQNWQAGLK